MREKMEDRTKRFKNYLPVNNAEDIDMYISFFEEQLDKSNDITHIGLTGIYGSGKSSVLETLINQKDFEKLTKSNTLRINYTQHFGEKENDVETILKNIIIGLLGCVK